MSVVVGTWSGYFAYPDGSKRDWSFTIGETANDTVFIGSGSESRGDFNIVAGQVIPAAENGTVTFAQIYKDKWEGQIWTYRGNLTAGGKTLSGEWFDSPADGRGRVGTWSVVRSAK